MGGGILKTSYGVKKSPLYLATMNPATTPQAAMLQTITAPVGRSNRADNMIPIKNEIPPIPYPSHNLRTPVSGVVTRAGMMRQANTRYTPTICTDAVTAKAKVI